MVSTAVGGLKPLGRPPLHRSVRESLTDLIAENDLKSGDALPTESALARGLGVSRNSVREAVKALESMGLVETRRGIGVFVRAFSFEPLIANLAFDLGRNLEDVEDVLEIRRTLEVALIERAVATIEAADIAALEDVLARMRAKAEQRLSFAGEDQEFHKLLFRCLDNRVLDRLIEVFWAAFHKASRIFDMVNPDPMATWRDHAVIVEAVVARDPEAARRRLASHYDGIAALLAGHAADFGKQTTTKGRRR